MTVPDPALVVLVGPTSSGKSTWATGRYRAQEIVSSDALRDVVGSGELDIEASVDAFALLDLIVAARTRRGLAASVTWTSPGARGCRPWPSCSRSTRPNAGDATGRETARGRRAP